MNKLKVAIFALMAMFVFTGCSLKKNDNDLIKINDTVITKSEFDKAYESVTTNNMFSQMGIDLEVHSCSKYFGGHSDIVAGIVVGKEADVKSIFDREHAFLGAKMSPFEAWLILRSLRTLKIRMMQHQENALAVAKMRYAKADGCFFCCNSVHES